jgi:hypothetical protein
MNLINQCFKNEEIENNIEAVINKSKQQFSTGLKVPLGGFRGKNGCKTLPIKPN